MRQLASSTPGELSVTLIRSQGKDEPPRTFASFASVREITNELIAERDVAANPVMAVELKYTFLVERR